MTSGHGDDRHLFPHHKIVADFSSNVPAEAEHTELWQHLTKHRDLISRYPEPEPFTLERELADLYGVQPEEILVTNGATEAIYLIAHTYSGATSTILQPTFAEYLRAATLYGHHTQQVTSLEGLQAVEGHTVEPPLQIGSTIPRTPSPQFQRLLWCCNPNNPTGITLPHTELLQLIDTHPETLFVVDQSYAAFTPKEVLSQKEATTRPNLILLYSLTKKYALPGLRLGYLITHATIAKAIRHYRMPWSVNALAIEAGRYLIPRAPHWNLADLLGERKRVTDALQKMGAYTIHPTDTHYFLATTHRGTAQELKEWLVQEHGILIRNASNFPTLSPHHFRIAIQTPHENSLLIDALAQWIAT